MLGGTVLPRALQTFSILCPLLITTSFFYKIQVTQHDDTTSFTTLTHSQTPLAGLLSP